MLSSQRGVHVQPPGFPPQVGDPFLLPQLGRRPADVRHDQPSLLRARQTMAPRGVRSRAASQGLLHSGGQQERQRRRKGGEQTGGRGSGPAAGVALRGGVCQDGREREQRLRAPRQVHLQGSAERRGGTARRVGWSQVPGTTGVEGGRSGRRALHHPTEKQMLQLKLGRWWRSLLLWSPGVSPGFGSPTCGKNEILHARNNKKGFTDIKNCEIVGDVTVHSVQKPFFFVPDYHQRCEVC